MSKKSFLVICGLMLGMSVNAQYLRTSYFMEGTSSRLQLNRVCSLHVAILIFRL